jgi:hypothetical protein
MPTVLCSPALALLLELEDAALAIGAELSITITDTGRLHVAPKCLLTPERSDRIRALRDALRLLVQVASPCVQARAESFRRQLRKHDRLSAYPVLRFRVPVTPGGCVSCGEPWAGSAFCGACQIATRLARDGDLSVEWVPAGRPVSLVAV